MPFRKIFQYVGDTPIIPLSFKNLGVFSCLLLLSNFTTNIINILLNQHEIISLTNTIMVGQLKDLYTASSNQYEIYSFSQDKESTIRALEQVSTQSFSNSQTIATAVDITGNAFFYMSATGEKKDIFPDMNAITALREAKNNNVLEGSITFMNGREEYFGVYKYHADWDFYLILAESRSEVRAASFRVFGLIVLVIFMFIIAFWGIGMLIFTHMLSPIKKMIASLYKMQEEKNMALLDLEGASNDDISYLGASFNVLSSTINNLLMVFQKFVSQDLVDKAYKEGVIHLEGNQRELVVLFSDIRGFTYMTEVMGNDIINLLNIHYDRAIRTIHDYDGIIGSIIGDALLAIYGVKANNKNKAVDSINSAWRLIHETRELREKLIIRRKEIEQTRTLSEAEERVYKAVLIDVGVGIDGGTVFYGNIGSFEHMKNTVIGDNVNAASRLEGLTRVYGLPVIVSEYIKEEVLKKTRKYRFVEIDMVQVKGKTEGKKIYYPLDIHATSDEDKDKYTIYEKALYAYYEGDWNDARELFISSKLEVSQVFIERLTGKNAPEGWNGIWTMNTK